MAKKEKVVDLKPTSITKEELAGLQELVNNLNRAQIEIGSLETKKHALLHQVTQFQGQMQTMQKTFEDTYGKVDINIQNGTINYPENEQANS
tara:strand:- start:4 stop:279 length:276 start_codon:yes stop_codon:yes gene_type:complete